MKFYRKKTKKSTLGKRKEKKRKSTIIRSYLVYFIVHGMKKYFFNNEWISDHKGIKKKIEILLPF